jgi:hypothetical protein
MTRRMTSPGGDTTENRQTTRKLALLFSELNTPYERLLAEVMTATVSLRSTPATHGFDLLAAIAQAKKDAAHGK